MPYDPFRDFQPVVMYALVPYAIAVHPSVPAKDLGEFIAFAKARPGKLFFGTAGIASTPHLCGELLNLAAGVNLVTVHYKGGAPAVIDTIAGQVQMYCSGLAPLIPQAKAGRLRILAVTTPQRSASMPELPTADSQGLPGFDVNSWNGIFVPRGTPPAVVRRLHDAVAKIMATAEMKRYMLEQGLEIAMKGPDEFGAYLKAESEKWGKVIRAAGIRVE
jgi:tripartite-type tricarboxylate transporter receptor subunit TctC